jgi:hypothetical protein
MNDDEFIHGSGNNIPWPPSIRYTFFKIHTYIPLNAIQRSIKKLKQDYKVDFSC